MGQEKRLQRWIERYESFHTPTANQSTHTSGMCSSDCHEPHRPSVVCTLTHPRHSRHGIPHPISRHGAAAPWLPFYYLMLSIPVLLGVLFWFLLSSAMVLSVEASPLSLFWSSSVLLSPGMGRTVLRTSTGREKNLPFLKIYKFLLISPAWLIDWLHQRWLRAMGSYLVACAVVLMVCDALFAMKPSIDFFGFSGQSRSI